MANGNPHVCLSLLGHSEDEILAIFGDLIALEVDGLLSLAWLLFGSHVAPFRLHFGATQTCTHQQW